MTYSLTATWWSKSFPNGRRQVVATVVTDKLELDLVEARQEYADQQHLTLLSGDSYDRVALYWNKDNRLVRLAIEWLPESSSVLNLSDHV